MASCFSVVIKKQSMDEIVNWLYPIIRQFITKTAVCSDSIVKVIKDEVEIIFKCVVTKF